MYAEKYQWIKGEKTGNVEQYASHDNEWVYFVGGSRINVQLLQEFMLQVDANTPLDFSITRQDMPVQAASVVQRNPVQKKEEFNPVKSLLKQASKDNLKCTYNFEISIPKKSVYNLIEDSFETDTSSLILELIMADIKKDELYKLVEEQIKEQILKFYNNGNNTTNRTTGTGESRSKEKSIAVDEQSPA